jgi:hypothetical protein
MDLITLGLLAGGAYLFSRALNKQSERGWSELPTITPFDSQQPVAGPAVPVLIVPSAPILNLAAPEIPGVKTSASEISIPSEISAPLTAAVESYIPLWINQGRSENQINDVIDYIQGQEQVNNAQVAAIISGSPSPQFATDILHTPGYPLAYVRLRNATTDFEANWPLCAGDQVPSNADTILFYGADGNMEFRMIDELSFADVAQIRSLGIII